MKDPEEPQTMAHARADSLGDPVVEERARSIRLVLMDADGVLTDGRILMSPDGGEWKSFDPRDGLGVRLGQRAGLSFGLISGRSSEAVRHRALELDFVAIHQKVDDKLTVFERVRGEQGLEPAEVAFIGDDLVDIPPLVRAGLACSVPGAPPEVYAVAQLVTSRPGGRGALREVIEVILKAQGTWPGLLKAYGVNE